MENNLKTQLQDLQADIDAVRQGTRLSPRELESRANRILDAIAKSTERHSLAPQIQSLVTALDRLVRTLEDKTTK